MYQHTDYFEKYGRIMQFNKNKTEPFHRWYSFVEGYSKEFIQSIIKEMNKDNLVCLEPFSGSGTTALELQNLGIPCYAFEINPLMYLIARVKLENRYEIRRFDYWYNYIKNKRIKQQVVLNTKFNTLYQGNGKKKWNYNIEVGIAVEKLKEAIESITEEIYKELFTVALAAILLDVSNLYRNGKCLSYKKNWEERKVSEVDVFTKFDDKVENELRNDIKKLKKGIKIHNKECLYNLDSRVAIEERIANNSIDLVITSPPYLNSRDYTDTYMLELKTLGFTKTSEEIKELREKTIRSHVQIKWSDSNQILFKTPQIERKKEWFDDVAYIIGIYGEEKIFDFIYRDPEYRESLDGNSTYNLNLGKDNATVRFLNSFKSAFEEKLTDKQITLENKKYLELYFEYVFGKILRGEG